MKHPSRKLSSSQKLVASKRKPSIDQATAAGRSSPFETKATKLDGTIRAHAAAAKSSNRAACEKPDSRHHTPCDDERDSSHHIPM
jgi:hypothetical protein